MSTETTAAKATAWQRRQAGEIAAKFLFAAIQADLLAEGPQYDQLSGQPHQLILLVLEQLAKPGKDGQLIGMLDDILKQHLEHLRATSRTGLSAKDIARIRYVLTLDEQELKR